jgi:hypothetical protein
MRRSCSLVPCFPQAALTASHICTEKSTSLCENVSGLYSYRNWVPYFAVYSSESSRTSLVCSTARAMVCSSECLNTTSLKRQQTALYMWMMTLFAPAMDSNVLRMRSARAGVSTYRTYICQFPFQLAALWMCLLVKQPHTWSHTSSGTSPLVIRPLTKPKSVSLAAGYAISTSLKPDFTICRKKWVFWLTDMGFANAWLPSRRSVESQIGGDFATFEGHVR